MMTKYVTSGEENFVSCVFRSHKLFSFRITPQCGPGLVCFEKKPLTAVPGCAGGENDISKS